MTQRRRFNSRERTALYLAADGRCSECGTELEPGWHADHVHPYSRLGKTDVTNGQALCPPCNLKKGAKVLREWQQQAKESFLAHGKPDFLLSATPGAGKTRFALDLARDLISAGQVERVIVIVPSDTLRQQWADQGDDYGVPLIGVSDPADYEKRGYRGCVVTYAQLRHGAALLRRATHTPTLAILDEIHHAGEKRAWGDDLRYAVGSARYRLALTGTPWRRDKHTPIPFIEYDDDGTVIVDHAYEYGQAVADGVCRPIEFHAYDGDANWRDPFLSDPLVSAPLTEVGKNDVGIALSTVFNPGSPWITTLLAKGAAALDAMREEVPDAGGLVVADDQSLAVAYAAELERITGEKPALATSDIPDAKTVIDGFRRSRQRWIVAVRMVSEGVDIKRLAVGIYATRARTPLLFRQITGRFVRMRAETDPNSLLFIPAVPEFIELAREIEDELRHTLEEEAKRETAERDTQEPLDAREGLSASEATLDRAILKGEDLTAAEVASAEAECRHFGIPVSSAAAVARLLRERTGLPPDAAEPVAVVAPKPRHRQERLLRAEVERLARRLAIRKRTEYRMVNTELIRRTGVRRAKASVEELETMKQVLMEWLAQA